MRVLVQWTAAADPQDWQELDSAQWAALPADAVHAVNVQGVIFEGFDFYAVEDLKGGACAVSVWNDPGSPDPWHRWEFLPLAYDPAVGGLNTRQMRQLYHPTIPGAKPRSAMRKPIARKPGRWVSDRLHEAHVQVRSHRGWEEWK